MNQLIKFKNEKGKIIVFLFFLIYLVLGVVIHDDYGASWDEHLQRISGVVNLNYILDGSRALFVYPARYYGAFFEVILVLLERFFQLTGDPRSIYFLRHLGIFFVFYLGVCAFYRAAQRYFKDWKISLLGCLFMVLSPRIFAHSFYNSKDIIFLSFFIMSMLTLIRYLQKKTYFNAFLHALCCALAIDVRIAGVFVPMLTILFLIADQFVDKNRVSIEKLCLQLLFFALMLIGLTIVFWPTLWERPLYHFVEAYKEMSRYPSDGSVLYWGQYVQSQNLPWHYIPSWILITTPVLYSLLFFVGVFVITRNFVKEPLRYYRNHKEVFVFLSWFFLPLISVIALKSVMYDAWRQIFFIYPAFILITLAAVKQLYQYGEKQDLKKRGGVLRGGLYGTILFSLAFTAVTMVKDHPHQNVYFNIWTRKAIPNLRNNFELDYWGLSYRKSLEYIVAHDQRDEIKVYAVNSPGQTNASILPNNDRRRLKFVTYPPLADYFISNFRNHKDDYTFGEEVYAVMVEGVKINVVIKF